MLRSFGLFVGLFALIPTGCDPFTGSSKPAKPGPTPTSTPAAPTKPEPKPASTDAESLPEAPLADPKSKLTPLNKEKTLYLEKKPNGEMRVLVVTEVCLREGLLEVLLCKQRTKEHESILRVDLDPRYIHAALVATGAKVGSPVQFVNPKSGDLEYKPASGQKIRVSVHYRRDGELHTHPAQEWVLDKKAKKPMAYDWVFAGSRFIRNPDAPKDDPEYYSANNGEVICLSNFVDSMLDLPVEVSKDEVDLHFEPITAKIPPLKSKVWLILEPIAEKK